MIDVIKKQGTRFFAYKLGETHPVITQLISEAKIIPCENDSYEVMTIEAIHGKSGKGEVAKSGDFIKIDSTGFPYPNDAAFFLANHRKISGDEYEQIPRVLKAWTAQEPMCDEILYLVKNKGLVISENDEAQYFTAPLWGTVESAPKDAVLVFYRIERDENNQIIDADFNFVIREAFDNIYDIIST